MDSDIYMGPVISAKAKANIERYIEIGVEQGSRLLLDGRNPELPEKIKTVFLSAPRSLQMLHPAEQLLKKRFSVRLYPS